MTTPTTMPGLEKAQISMDNISSMIQNLSNMYKNPAYAVLREWVANAIDSVNQAYADGEIDDIKRTIHIQLPNHNDRTLSVTDYGLGMSRKHLIDHALNYGNSTKRDNAGQIGKFGLGFNSGLALASQFTVTTVRNGKKTHGFMSLGDSTTGVEYFASNEIDTDEPNHTEVSVLVPENLHTRVVMLACAEVLTGHPGEYFTIDESGTRKFETIGDVSDLYYKGPGALQLTGSIWSNYPSRVIARGCRVVIGGIVYPIEHQLIEHRSEINRRLSDLGIAFDVTKLRNTSLYIELDEAGIDIPDNRDHIIFNANAVDNIAEKITDLRCKADAKIDEITQNRTAVEAICHMQSNLNPAEEKLLEYSTVWLESYQPMHGFAKRVAEAKLADDQTNAHAALTTQQEQHFIVTTGYDGSKNAFTLEMPEPANIFGQRCFAYSDGIKPVFVKLNPQDYQRTETDNDGKTSTYFVDHKGRKHRYASELVEALINANKTKLLAWRRHNGTRGETFLLGPNEECFHFEREDFEEILTFDELCEKAQQLRKAELAKKKKSEQGDTATNITFNYVGFYTVNGWNEVKQNVSIEGVKYICDGLDIAYADMPYVVINNGRAAAVRTALGKVAYGNRRSPMMVLRGTQHSAETLQQAGFTHKFDSVKAYNAHLGKKKNDVAEQALQRLSEDKIANLKQYIWVNEHMSYDLSWKDTYAPDGIIERVDALVVNQFKTLNINVENDPFRIKFMEFKDSVNRGRKLFDRYIQDQIPESLYNNVPIEGTDFATSQFRNQLQAIDTLNDHGTRRITQLGLLDKKTSKTAWLDPHDQSLPKWVHAIHGYHGLYHGLVAAYMPVD